MSDVQYQPNPQLLELLQKWLAMLLAAGTITLADDMQAPEDGKGAGTGKRARTQPAAEDEPEETEEIEAEEIESEDEEPTKRAVKKSTLEASVSIFKIGTDEERISTAVVYAPRLSGDTQGDRASAAEIRKAAYRYMIESQGYDYQHLFDVEKGRAYIVESYIAPVDFDYPLPDGTSKPIRKGSWLATTYYADDALWQQVKTGVIKAYSIRGTGKRKRLT